MVTFGVIASKHQAAARQDPIETISRTFAWELAAQVVTLDGAIETDQGHRPSCSTGTNQETPIRAGTENPTDASLKQFVRTGDEVAGLVRLPG